MRSKEHRIALVVNIALGGGRVFRVCEASGSG